MSMNETAKALSLFLSGILVTFAGCAADGEIHPAGIKEYHVGTVLASKAVNVDEKTSERLCKIERLRGGDSCIRFETFSFGTGGDGTPTACKMKVRDDDDGKIYEGLALFCYPPGEKVVFSYDAQNRVLRNMRSYE